MEKEKILAALIALGRSTEGNKNRPNENTHSVLLSGIKAVSGENSLSESEQQALIDKIHEEKFRIVARCLTCPKQCGRNEDYSFISEKDSPLLPRKYVLFSLVESIGINLCNINKEDEIYQQSLDYLYDALFWLGKEVQDTKMKLFIISGGNILEKIMNESFNKN